MTINYTTHISEKHGREVARWMKEMQQVKLHWISYAMEDGVEVVQK